MIKFMNLQLIDTPEPQIVNSDTSRQDEDQSIFETDPVLREYEDCFSDKPGKLLTKVHLDIDPSVPPVVQPPRKIRIALLEPAQEKLKEMEEDDIIVKVEEHTHWVSSMLVVDKRKAKDRDMNIPPSKDDARNCIDARDLNKALKGPYYPMVTVEEVANRLSDAKSFTSLDACDGYWQLQVDDESSKLLTFNTPWGCYRFTRLPFRISPAAEIYQREMDRLFEGVPVQIIVGDFLIHSEDQREMDQKLRVVLDKSREVGLKFNPQKVKLRVPRVSYVGHILSSEGLKPDPEKSGPLIKCCYGLCVFFHACFQRA